LSEAGREPAGIVKDPGSAVRQALDVGAARGGCNRLLHRPVYCCGDQRALTPVSGGPDTLWFRRPALQSAPPNPDTKENPE
jgi:hypothetical protein